MIKSRPAAPGDVPQILADVRQVDRQEWEVGLNRPLAETLPTSLDIPGSHNFILMEDGITLALFGVHPEGFAGVGRAWFIGTRRLMARASSAHRNFKEGIAELHRHFPLLVAESWWANYTHHRWMERTGFVRCPETVERRGSVFLEFHRWGAR